MKRYPENMEEKISLPKERLLNLEKEGRFVFHGSASETQKLTPKQPMIYDNKLKKQREHGASCVAATSFAEVAIFRAIINPQNFDFKGYRSSFGVSNGKQEFTTTKRVFDQVEGKTGYVHVLDKESFNRFSSMEWRSEEGVKPVEIIQVTSKDLPENIEITGEGL